MLFWMCELVALTRCCILLSFFTFIFGIPDPDLSIHYTTFRGQFTYEPPHYNACLAENFVPPKWGQKIHVFGALGGDNV